MAESASTAASDESTPSSEPAADVFRLLGDETRLAIVRVLAAADEPLRFTTLRERVGAADSGRFNYHLGKLRGELVHETADGYELSAIGRRLTRLVPE